MIRASLLILIVILASPLWAVEPDEILEDPALENRARELSKGLRCLVCQNESIDESNAPLARDLRILVRDRLTAGDTDAQALDFIVARYGEYVLLNPKASGSTWLLWGAGPAMFLLALGLSGTYLRRRAAAPEPETANAPLSKTEQARLDELMGKK